MNNSPQQMINFNDEMKNINDSCEEEDKRAWEIINGAHIIKKIKIYNLVTKLYKNQMYTYCNYDHTYETKISSYYQGNDYSDEIVKMLINKINTQYKFKMLLQNNNIINDTNDKFVVIYEACAIIDFPSTHIFKKYKYDYIRMCIEDRNYHVFCVDKEKNLINDLNSSNDYVHYDFKSVKTDLCNDIVVKDAGGSEYLVFSLDDFYKAIRYDDIV